jgi:hypothetical protein
VRRRMIYNMYNYKTTYVFTSSIIQ